MKPEETKRIADFLGSLLNGAADLGITALPLLNLYKRARDERLDFWLLVLSDPTTADALAKAIEQHAIRVSPRLIAAMKLVIQAHDDASLRKKQEAESLKKARATTDDLDV